jgi:hypothetical protein
MNQMKKITIALLLSVVLVLGTVGFAAAVTNGELDGDNHPFVGIMVAKNAGGSPMWMCSGTLISETVFLTAGHCTESPAARVEIWFYNNEEEILANGWPFTGQTGGTPYVHPEYYDAPFFVHDVGVVVLDEPYPMDEYGVLPQLNQLDDLKTRRGKQDVTFTAVGYGLQQINPVFVEHRLDRMYSTPHLIQINVPGFTGDFSLLLSNNHSTGGTCYGDSGGPNFLGNSHVIAGVTSFGINGNCAGTGGVFRMDREDVLDFVNSFLE